jgi:imidazolonepropionase-like amidohydrolase
MAKWLMAAVLVSATPMAIGADLGADVAPFVGVSAARFAVRHVTVIDGTGAPARADQTVVIADGRIAAIGPATTTRIPDGAEVHDYPGFSVMPGLVGLHDHLYYTASASTQRGGARPQEPGVLLNEIAYSAPRLYLAGGVTTLRTTGSMEPYTDLKVRARIEAGLMPGPALDLTAPYLEGRPAYFAQMHELAGPEEARRFVGYWAEAGMTSFKAYVNVTRAELAAAAAETHRRGFKITAHLCSVTWPEAVEAGIDDLEHGPVYTDTEFAVNRKPDVCPGPGAIRSAWLGEPMDGARVKALIGLLIAHHVAVTSTLPVFELAVAGRPSPQRRVLDAMSAAARESYLWARAMVDQTDTAGPALFRKEMDFERAFAAAGGLLLAGSDPTGSGGVLPGFGNQREVELLVEAGFSPPEAIRIATLNGARFLGREADIGTLAAGKRADLVLVKGDPASRIEDIENVEIVFRDGIGYDSRKLIESVRGQVGIR